MVPILGLAIRTESIGWEQKDLKISFHRYSNQLTHTREPENLLNVHTKAKGHHLCLPQPCSITCLEAGLVTEPGAYFCLLPEWLASELWEFTCLCLVLEAGITPQWLPHTGEADNLEVSPSTGLTASVAPDWCWKPGRFLESYGSLAHDGSLDAKFWYQQRNQQQGPQGQSIPQQEVRPKPQRWASCLLSPFLPGLLTEGAAHSFFWESSLVNQGNQDNLTLKSTITSVVSRESNQEIDLGAEVSCFHETPFLFRRMIEKLWIFRPECLSTRVSLFLCLCQSLK